MCMSKVGAELGMQHSAQTEEMEWQEERLMGFNSQLM